MASGRPSSSAAVKHLPPPAVPSRADAAAASSHADDQLDADKDTIIHNAPSVAAFGSSSSSSSASAGAFDSTDINAHSDDPFDNLTADDQEPSFAPDSGDAEDGPTRDNRSSSDSQRETKKPLP